MGTGSTGSAAALAGAAAATPGARTTVAAVLFCDLRGFSATAAALPAERVHELLSRYYAALAPSVRCRRAAVVQCVGDEIFAVFVDDAGGRTAVAQALGAGCEMVARGERLRRSLAVAGLPPVAFGIGVHVGVVALGPSGAGWQPGCAVAGDAVNVGHRLCGEAAAGEVVVSAECRAASARPDRFDERPGTVLRGRPEAVSVFCLRAPEGRPAPHRPGPRRPRSTRPTGTRPTGTAWTGPVRDGGEPAPRRPLSPSRAPPRMAPTGGRSLSVAPS